jgi:hypothetical protein
MSGCMSTAERRGEESHCDVTKAAVLAAELQVVTQVARLLIAADPAKRRSARRATTTIKEHRPMKKPVFDPTRLTGVLDKVALVGSIAAAVVTVLNSHQGSKK